MLYAKEVIQKQDILKMFLMEVLMLEEDQAEKEAIAMKHAISEQTTKKLNQYITQIMDLGDLDCDYDATSKKCQNCVKITAKNRLIKKGNN